MSTSIHQQTVTNSLPAKQSKPLTGRGMFKGKLGGTQALFEQKQEDLKREIKRAEKHC